ncbi:MAG TPA: hypothetical protein VJC39_04645 [Candidatus Nanoarchaeia archaeon]|nr:hypothetical protein [Candidatus Nanoarchaeia archaeon]
MAVTRTKLGFIESLNLGGGKLSDFFSFIAEKLNNFKTLSIGEQVSYLIIGGGLLLILISIMLFII